MEIKEDLITKIGHSLMNSAPFSDWHKITFKYHQVSNWAQGFLFYFNNSEQGVWASSSDVSVFVNKLRKQMAQEQNKKGTWYEMKMEINSAGKFKIDFEYDIKPDFGFEILDETFIADFKMFPRKAEYIPAWLKEILDRHNVKVDSN